MLERVKRWVSKQREWKRVHLLTWKGQTEPDSDGWSPLLHVLHDALIEVVNSHALQNKVEARRDAASRAVSLEVLLPTVKVRSWLHSDTAEIATESGDELFRCEEWDERTPDDFVQHYKAALVEAIGAKVQGDGDAV